MTWFILDRNGNPMPQEELPQRPEDAKPDAGDSYTPWYKEDEHLHVEDGKIQGIHTKAESLETARERLNYFLTHEALLINAFGGQEDILIPDAERVISAKS